MRSVMRITLFTIFFFSLVISSAYSAKEQRTALVIGNSAYSSGPLKNPVNDAADMAAILKKLGFTVTLSTDADLRVMKDEIDNFGDSLRRGGVGLFFYAGHGIQLGGVNYLIPIRANIRNERMVEHEALDVNRLLSTLDNAGNSVNIVMLDACRDNPVARSFRSAGRGLAVISKTPPSTIISFSTGVNQVAADGDGRNSPYTEALLQHIKTPGLPVEQVFKRVRNNLVDSTQGKQEPAEYTTLRKEFYFIPSGEQEVHLPAAVVEIPVPAPTSAPVIVPTKQDFVMARPPVPLSDGRFTAYDNKTVLDTRTNLMWAAWDEYSGDKTWEETKQFCESYRVGGYSDWRMPTSDELKGLYDSSKSYKPRRRDDQRSCHLTELIQLSTCYVWASESDGSDAAYLNMTNGSQQWYRPGFFAKALGRPVGLTALPVRSAK